MAFFPVKSFCKCLEFAFMTPLSVWSDCSRSISHLQSTRGASEGSTATQQNISSSRMLVRSCFGPQRCLNRIMSWRSHRGAADEDLTNCYHHRSISEGFLDKNRQNPIKMLWLMPLQSNWLNSWMFALLLIKPGSGLNCCLAAFIFNYIFYSSYQYILFCFKDYILQWPLPFFLMFMTYKIYCNTFFSCLR